MRIFLVNEKELQELLKAYCQFQALECGGVDNWEWYGEAMCNYLEDEGCQKFDDVVKNMLKSYKVYE